MRIELLRRELHRQSRSRKTIGNRRKYWNDVDHGDPREKGSRPNIEYNKA
jgi:hypothetical protein